MTKPNGADMQVEWEKTRVNMWHILAIGGSLVVNAFAMGGIYVTMTGNDEDNAKQIKEVRTEIGVLHQSGRDRSREIDSKFYTIEQKIPEITRLDDKITRLTELVASVIKANEETNKRIDRVVESQNGKLDTLIARQSDQSADIKVIQSQLREQNRTPQRTRFPIATPNRMK